MNFICETTTSNLIDKRNTKLRLPVGEGVSGATVAMELLLNQQIEP